MSKVVLVVRAGCAMCGGVGLSKVALLVREASLRSPTASPIPTPLAPSLPHHPGLHLAPCKRHAMHLARGQTTPCQRLARNRKCA